MNKFSLVLAVLTLILMSCNDPTPIGSELLAQDQANVVYTDTVTLTATTVPEDTVLVYDPNPSIAFDEYLFGDFDDPIFGNIKASIYAQLQLDFNPPNYDNAEIDSIILTLDYDSIATYGDILNKDFALGVYRITDAIDVEERYFSAQTFGVNEAMPIYESMDFTPKTTSLDSLTIIDYSVLETGDTITLKAHLRLKLPNDFGQELLDLDSASYVSSANFIEQFPGIFVKPLNTTDGILGFDLTSPISALTTYYKIIEPDDTIQTQYRYRFSNQFVRFNNFEHDYTGSTIEPFIDDQPLGDSILFVQSMAGTNIKLDFPYAEQFEDIIVNKAELEFTIAVLDGDDEDNFPPLQQMIIGIFDEDNTLVFINDVIIGGPFFGGGVIEEVENGTTLMRYRMNISAHFQEIVEGLEDETIYLRAFPKQERARRVVVYGPGHSEHPAKLNLTYTKINQ